MIEVVMVGLMYKVAGDADDLALNQELDFNGDKIGESLGRDLDTLMHTAGGGGTPGVAASEEGTIYSNSNSISNRSKTKLEKLV
ncbi:hypothetical protein M5D96_008312 [Drosophila gunungcola]|uniref:Uncharacterized protein n=1 Tax=Drosophila gunungcola TaxID=103775 RepID=A0A9P9YKW1_9MUSC|nr:hypothetical protein M5D96_008312 [Drosophila gunungcola]